MHKCYINTLRDKANITMQLVTLQVDTRLLPFYISHFNRFKFKSKQKYIATIVQMEFKNSCTLKSE